MALGCVIAAVYDAVGPVNPLARALFGAPFRDRCVLFEAIARFSPNGAPSALVPMARNIRTGMGSVMVFGSSADAAVAEVPLDADGTFPPDALLPIFEAAGNRVDPGPGGGVIFAWNGPRDGSGQE